MSEIFISVMLGMINIDNIWWPASFAKSKFSLCVFSLSCKPLNRGIIRHRTASTRYGDFATIACENSTYTKEAAKKLRKTVSQTGIFFLTISIFDVEFVVDWKKGIFTPRVVQISSHDIVKVAFAPWRPLRFSWHSAIPVDTKEKIQVIYSTAIENNCYWMVYMHTVTNKIILGLQTISPHALMYFPTWSKLINI